VRRHLLKLMVASLLLEVLWDSNVI
jgi:hypothetical protein